MALPGLEDDDRLLADRIAGYWARFARTGDPNGNGAPLWPAYTRKAENYLVLDNPITTGNGYQDKACDFVEEMETAKY
jgi:carboxylesterase type B